MGLYLIKRVCVSFMCKRFVFRLRYGELCQKLESLILDLTTRHNSNFITYISVFLMIPIYICRVTTRMEHTFSSPIFFKSLFCFVL